MTMWCLSLLGLLVGTPAADVVFEDDFESGLREKWRVVAGAPKVVADPDRPDEHVLELGPSSKIMVRLEPPVRDLVVEARVRFAERRRWVEAPLLIRSSDDGQRAIQVYLEQTGNQVIAVRYRDGAVALARSASPVPLKIGSWYTFKVIAVGGRIAAWVDGRLALMFVDDAPRAGCIGARVGDARSLYDDVRVRRPSPEERQQMRRLRVSGRPCPSAQTSTFRLPDGSKVVLQYPDVVEPLTPFEVAVASDRPGPYTLVVGKRKVTLTPGTPARLALSGAEGERTARLLHGGAEIGTVGLVVQAATFLEAGPFTKLFDQLCDRVRRDRHGWTRKGGIINTNPTWVRDHIHEMKAYKFWEQDLTSFVDTLVELQHAEGFYYEIIGRADHDHQTYVNEKHRRIEKDEDLCWIRLEMEADVEYLMVEAAYAIWQATGDLASMRRRLPSLERALRYDFTHPTRWDATHGALKRTFSIDTWDFTYGWSDHNRKIEPTMPMGIMHGDNSGLYQACRQLAAMYRAAGKPDKAEHWDRQGAELRERINKLCFNGRYYTHQILLQPVDTGVKEEDILSLSNTYDVNRGLPTHAMAVKIIDEYQVRRKRHARTHFAEWYSIDPPYPKFGPCPAGRYINGGIAGFVAGELAKAALDHGRERYGADVLERVAKKVAEDGHIGFLYTTDGKDMGGGPQGWSAAAVISALVEGLAGIRDEATRFERVTVSPRFVAAGIDTARVCARYGPSGAYVTLDYGHAREERAIRLRLAGVARRTHVRVLLPEGAKDARLVSPRGTSAGMETVEQSHYLVFDLPSPLTEGVVEAVVRYGR